MSRTRAQKEEKAGPFFLATLVLWFVSVLFEILFHRRSQLLSIVAGCFFYQLANWVVRAFVSRDPLFVNTSVSLLHSTITSSSVIFILANQWLKNGSIGMFEALVDCGLTTPSTFLSLERVYPPSHRVQIEQLRARDQVRHARLLQNLASSVVDFPLHGTSDPNVAG